MPGDRKKGRGRGGGGGERVVSHRQGDDGGPAPSVVGVDLVELVVVVERVLLQVVVEVTISRAAPISVLHLLQQSAAGEGRY